MTLVVTPVEIVRRAEEAGHPTLLSRAPGWGRIPLGEVATITNGAPFSSRLFNTDGRGMPLVRIRDVVRGRTDTYYEGPYEDQHLIEKGDLLVGMDGDFRVAVWQGGKSLLNQRVCRIEVTAKDRYDPKFLQHVLQGYLDAIWAETSAVTVKHLSSKTLAQIPLPLPPLGEQRRVVAILEDHLSRLEAAETLTERCLTRTEGLRLHAIKSLLLGSAQDLSGQVELDDEGVNDSVVVPLPEGWQWTRLGRIAEVVGGVTKDAKKQSDPNYVEVPYLRVANVQRGRLDLRHVTRIRVSAEKASSLRLRPGDVLLNEGGDRNKLGRGWVWGGQIDGCIHQNHVFRARVDREVLDPVLVSWTANTLGGRWCEINGKQSVNLASISLNRIRLMPVPVPPKSLQADLLRAVEAVDVESTRLRDSLIRVRQMGIELRRSLLQDAFVGQLTRESALV